MNPGAQAGIAVRAAERHNARVAKKGKEKREVHSIHQAADLPPCAGASPTGVEHYAAVPTVWLGATRLK